MQASEHGGRHLRPVDEPAEDAGRAQQPAATAEPAVFSADDERGAGPPAA